jgi:hypothetical protein
MTTKQHETAGASQNRAEYLKPTGKPVSVSKFLADYDKAAPEAPQEWSGSQFALEPDKFWVDDATSELVSAETGERFIVSGLLAQRDELLEICKRWLDYDRNYQDSERHASESTGGNFTLWEVNVELTLAAIARVEGGS